MLKEDVEYILENQKILRQDTYILDREYLGKLLYLSGSPGKFIVSEHIKWTPKSILKI